MNPWGRKSSFDDDVTSWTKAAEKDCWRGSWEWWENLWDLSWSLIDQFQWLCFEHEAKEFLVWFRFEDDEVSIESIIQKDLVWRKRGEAFVSEDKTIVNISDMLDEQVMIGKKLVEGIMPDLFTDGYHHET